jgi:hypothetical protein
VISVNNNDNDQKIAFTSSSAVQFLKLPVLIHDYPINDYSNACKPSGFDIQVCVCFMLMLLSLLQ